MLVVDGLVRLFASAFWLIEALFNFLWPHYYPLGCLLCSFVTCIAVQMKNAIHARFLKLQKSFYVFLLPRAKMETLFKEEVEELLKELGKKKKEEEQQQQLSEPQKELEKKKEEEKQLPEPQKELKKKKKKEKKQLPEPQKEPSRVFSRKEIMGIGARVDLAQPWDDFLRFHSLGIPTEGSLKLPEEGNMEITTNLLPRGFRTAQYDAFLRKFAVGRTQMKVQSENRGYVGSWKQYEPKETRDSHSSQGYASYNGSEDGIGNGGDYDGYDGMESNGREFYENADTGHYEEERQQEWNGYERNGNRQNYDASYHSNENKSPRYASDYYRDHFYPNYSLAQQTYYALYKQKKVNIEPLPRPEVRRSTWFSDDWEQRASEKKVVAEEEHREESPAVDYSEKVYDYDLDSDSEDAEIEVEAAISEWIPRQQLETQARVMLDTIEDLANVKHACEKAEACSATFRLWEKKGICELDSKKVAGAQSALYYLEQIVLQRDLPVNFDIQLAANRMLK